MEPRGMPPLLQKAIDNDKRKKQNKNKKEEGGKEKGEEEEEEEEKDDLNDDLRAMKKLRSINNLIMKEGHLSCNVINAHPNDHRITFVDEGHYYLKENGERFRISVTGFKKLFGYPFDRQKITEKSFGNAVLNKDGEEVVGQKPGSTYKSPYLGLTRKQVVEKSELKPLFGTKVHHCAEKYLTSLSPEDRKTLPMDRRMQVIESFLDVPVNDNFRKCFSQILQAEDIFHKQGWEVYRVEWVVYDSSLDLAGSIDLVLVKTTTNKNGDEEREFAIADWKTTDVKNIEETWDFKHKFLPFPLKHLKNCMRTEYELQMSIYAYIVKKYGLRVTKVFAVVLNYTKQIVSVYPSDPLYDEVESMIKIWRNYITVLEPTILLWESGEKKFDYLPDTICPLFYDRDDEYQSTSSLAEDGEEEREREGENEKE